MYKIIIFGTGGLANFLSDKLDKRKAEIIAYADSENFSGGGYRGIKVISPTDILNYEFNYVVIGFSDIAKGFEIMLSQGIPKEKIVAYSFIGAYGYKENQWQKKIEDIMHEEFNDKIIEKIFTISPKKSFLCAMNELEDTEIIESDFVREQTLGLIAKEIKRKGVNGNVAELGVFRGEFSKKINYLFPEKTLYLFDTFEGFNKKDILSDDALGSGEKLDKFNNTTVEEVLQKMPYREKCIVKQGFFPSTYDLINEKFSFVSIDVDLYEPIKSGLEIFYPLLEKGGYIMVHDYNNFIYKGATKAVREYCDEHSISYVPIPDIAGTVIITK